MTAIANEPGETHPPKQKQNRRSLEVTPRIRRRWLGMVVGCCLIVIGVAVARMLLPEPSLLQRSVVVTTNSNDLQWCVSESEVVLYHPYASPFPQIESRNPRAGRAQVFSVPFRDLNQKFSVDEVSPDGRWIKWFSDDHGSHLVTYNLETHRLIVWPSAWGGDGGSTFWWMPDSRHWLEYSYTLPGYRLHDIDHRHEVQSFRMKDDLLDDHSISVCSKQLIFYPFDGRTLQKPVRKGMEVVSIALEKEAQPRKYHPGIETEGEITEFVFSPDGNHIAWLVTYRPDSALIRLLRRLMPSRQTPFPPSQSIWITHLDGSHPQELGAVAIPSGEQSAIGHLHWLPNGKQVSFSAANYLYVKDCSSSL